MRASTLLSLSFFHTIALASPLQRAAEVPVYTPDELAARNIDVTSCFITTYTRSDCTGNAGTRNFSPGTCHTPGGPVRQSYTISSACPTLGMYLYYKTECSGTRPLEYQQGPGCWNIDSSYSINSLRAEY